MSLPNMNERFWRRTLLWVGVVMSVLIAAATVIVAFVAPMDSLSDIFPDERDRTGVHLSILQNGIMDQRVAGQPLPSSLGEVLARMSPEDRKLFERHTNDAWGRPIKYATDRNGFELRSAGPTQCLRPPMI